MQAGGGGRGAATPPPATTATQPAATASDRVVATARSPQTLYDLAEDHTDDLLAVALDVTDCDAVHSALRAAIDRFGSLDVVVNNAGYANVAPIETGDDEDFSSQFETNFWASTTSRKRRSAHRAAKAAVVFCSE
jgi:NADP-dependent 3-hydroxy acid dehydrogenase YdfG